MIFLDEKCSCVGMKAVFSLDRLILFPFFEDTFREHLSLTFVLSPSVWRLKTYSSLNGFLMGFWSCSQCFGSFFYFILHDKYFLFFMISIFYWSVMLSFR